MKSRKRSRKPLLPPCAELHPEDGVDPRTFFSDRPRHDRSDRKTMALCRQVEQALRLSLAGDDLESLTLISVEPAPDASRLLVRILAEDGDVVSAQEALRRGAPRLRLEVAAAIHRRRAPDLLFAVGGGEP